MRLPFLTFVLVLSITTPIKADDYVFRKVKWGMTVEEVAESERAHKNSVPASKLPMPSQPSKSYEKSTYYINMFQANVRTDYMFSNESKALSSIFISIPDDCLKSRTKEKCLNGINSLLITKYGPPTILKGEPSEDKSTHKNTKQTDQKIESPGTGNMHWPRRSTTSAELEAEYLAHREKMVLCANQTSIWQLGDKIIISQLENNEPYYKVSVRYFSPAEYARLKEQQIEHKYDKLNDLADL